MVKIDLIDRLVALPNLSKIPHRELEWLSEHGKFEIYQTGTVIAQKGKPIDKLWILLSGHIAVQVNRGSGPRRVMGWRTGDVSGMLPYSRMAAPPGDNYVEETTELLTIHTKYFPEMIHHCPTFTAYTVHSMLDRARSFNTSDLQDEKMISLGKLAAGLAHELNNPASAAKRGARLLQANLSEADAASRAFGAIDLTDEQSNRIKQMHSACLTQSLDTTLTPIQQADREDEIANWLTDHQCDAGYAALLADSDITTLELDKLAEIIPANKLDAALHWITADCASHLLAMDIELAATRIHEMVDAVKKFTYMDKLAEPDLVEMESGIRDTIKVLSSKVKSKNAAIIIDIEENLPKVRAIGSELNQVWMNLIDNALDAIPQSGNIQVSARQELNTVVVCVTDNGPGIPPEIMPNIFDPFFTTKPPGQGTGLGLEISRRLVRRYGGDIAVRSRPGETEFRITLMAENTTPSKSKPMHTDRKEN